MAATAAASYGLPIDIAALGKSSRDLAKRYRPPWQRW